MALTDTTKRRPHRQADAYSPADTPIRPRARAVKYSPMTTAHDNRLSQS